MFDYDCDGSLKVEAGFVDQVIIRSKLKNRDNLTTDEFVELLSQCVDRDAIDEFAAAAALVDSGKVEIVDAQRFKPLWVLFK